MATTLLSSSRSAEPRAAISDKLSRTRWMARPVDRDREGIGAARCTKPKARLGGLGRSPDGTPLVIVILGVSALSIGSAPIEGLGRCSIVEVQQGRHSLTPGSKEIPRLLDGENTAVGMISQPSLSRLGGGVEGHMSAHIGVDVLDVAGRLGLTKKLLHGVQR